MPGWTGRLPDRLTDIVPDWLMATARLQHAPVPWADMVRAALAIGVPLAAGNPGRRPLAGPAGGVGRAARRGRRRWRPDAHAAEAGGLGRGRRRGGPRDRVADPRPRLDGRARAGCRGRGQRADQLVRRDRLGDRAATAALRRVMPRPAGRPAALVAHGAGVPARLAVGAAPHRGRLAGLAAGGRAAQCRRRVPRSRPGAAGHRHDRVCAGPSGGDRGAERGLRLLAHGAVHGGRA